MLTFAVSFDVVGAPDDEGNRDLVDQGSDELPSLRDAVKWVRGTRTNLVGECMGIHAEIYNRKGRYISVYNDDEYETGCAESRALYIPDSVTPASARRIARVLKADNV